MNKKIGIVFFVIGILFILNAIFGRYIVLPGYLESLETGVSASKIPQNVPAIKILRYLLWAFSFKLGIFFSVFGILFINGRKLFDRIIFLITGLVYISTAYIELSFNYPIFFGIGGGIITISVIFIFWGINKHRENFNQGNILQNIGYFFLTMAAYNLCPFCGIKCFALYPEKMIRYGLQQTAVSFANHIMIELVIGFVCLAVYHLVNKKEKSV